MNSVSDTIHIVKVRLVLQYFAERTKQIFPCSLCKGVTSVLRKRLAI